MDGPSAAAVRTRVDVVGRFAFVALLAGVVGRLLFAGDLARQNVYLKVFVPAAEAFAAGRDLYALEGGFRYPPLAAVLLVPFAWCGPLLGSILWRGLMWLVLARGVRAVLDAGFPYRLHGGERGVFLLLLTLAASGSLNNGQPNVLILGWSLLACAAFLARRQVGPALCVTGSTVFKVYPLAFGLVLTALRPRLGVWLLPALALAVGLPFALQDPGYVAGQYRALVDLLRTEDRTTDFANAYRDLRLLCAVAGAPLPDIVFRSLQLLGGAAIAATCLLLRRRGAAPARVLEYAFSLTACWYMLLGPATEKVTYVLLAPSVAWLASAAWRLPGRAGRCYWTLVALLFALDHLAGPSRDLQRDWPWTRCGLPLAALLVAAGLAVRAVGDLRQRAMERAPGVG